MVLNFFLQQEGVRFLAFGRGSRCRARSPPSWHKYWDIPKYVPWSVFQFHSEIHKYNPISVKSVLTNVIYYIKTDLPILTRFTYIFNDLPIFQNLQKLCLLISHFYVYQYPNDIHISISIVCMPIKSDTNLYNNEIDYMESFVWKYQYQNKNKLHLKVLCTSAAAIFSDW